MSEPDTEEERALDISFAVIAALPFELKFWTPERVAEAIEPVIAAALRAAETGAIERALKVITKWFGDTIWDSGHEPIQELRALTASSPATASPWREIASAPKDGTEILVLSNGTRWIVAWQEFMLGSPLGGGWRVKALPGRDPTAYIRPKLWAPLSALPSPPASEGTK